VFRRYPYVRQHDQSDCGAAALAMVAQHHRRALSLEQARMLAGTDRVGTTLLGLVQAGEKLGFTARAVKGPYEGLPSVPLPAIVHIKNKEGLGHFIVLYRWSKRSVTVADPAHGIVKMSRAEFCKCWTGYVVVMIPDAHARRPFPKGTTPGPVRRFLALLAPHVGILIEAALCALVMTVLGMANSYFIQHLVDSVLVRSETRLLNALALGMVLLLVFRVLFSLLRQCLVCFVARRIDIALMSGYGRHLLGLPMPFFEMRRVGEILSRFHDAAKVRDAISGAVTTVFVDGVMVAGMVVVLWLYDLPLAAVATAFVPLLVGSILLHQPFLLRRSRETMEHSAQLSAHLVENVSGVETIKTFGVERARAEEAELYQVRLMKSIRSLQRLATSSSTLGMMVTSVAGLAILWYGGHRVMSGALTIGQLMFFSSLLGYLLGPLERLAGVNQTVQDALIAVDRLYQVLDLELEAVGAGNKVPFQRIRQGIELRGVSFKYGCRANVLNKLNLMIPAGKTVAVVGESGSGKSTLLKLLQGFYTPTDGRLLLDGVDLCDVELGSLRRGVGVVSQDAFVFNGTLRQNISVGRPEATMEEVMAAARAAGLEEFINGLPERYETVIGERGANLSGGQRQRLAIARVLLKKPDLLIFDEATSHLDTATERAIQENLKAALAGRTVVLVAHRLSTIRDADHICVLHKGEVVEEGTHQELIQGYGRYAALWRAQSDQAPISAPRPEKEETRMLGLYLEGRSPREIARDLGTTDRRVQRLLERLRGRVEREGFNGLFSSLAHKAPQPSSSGEEANMRSVFQLLDSMEMQAADFVGNKGENHA
jgi:ATP-binding cassette subfamily B protein